MEIIYSLNDKQIGELHELYQQEWWTKGRKLDDVKKMLENTDVLVGLSDGGKLIGFLRVLTDYTYKALVMDVIVNKNYRGQDLGRTLLNAMFDVPSLQTVKHFDLFCRPEMIDFYKKWGFTDEMGELRFMRKVKEEKRFL